MILLFNNLKIGVTMKNIHYLSYLYLILFLIGCGSKSGPDLSPEASRKTLKNVPSWYLDNPIKKVTLDFIKSIDDGKLIVLETQAPYISEGEQVNENIVREPYLDEVEGYGGSL